MEKDKEINQKDLVDKQLEFTMRRLREEAMGFYNKSYLLNGIILLNEKIAYLGEDIKKLKKEE